MSFLFVGSCSHLDLDSGLGSLALLLLASNGLGAHDTTTPVAAVLLVLVRVTLLYGGDELGELGLVLGADLGESEDGGGLVVKLAKRYFNKKKQELDLTFLWTTVPRRALPLTMA